SSASCASPILSSIASICSGCVAMIAIASSAVVRAGTSCSPSWAQADEVAPMTNPIVTMTTKAALISGSHHPAGRRAHHAARVHPRHAGRVILHPRHVAPVLLHPRVVGKVLVHPPGIAPVLVEVGHLVPVRAHP